MKQRLIVATVVVLSACAMVLGTWLHGKNTGEQQVLSLWNKERAEQSNVAAQSQEKLRNLELKLIEHASDLKKEANAQIYALVVQRDALRRRLQHAQRTAATQMSCTPSIASAGGTTEGNTGAEFPGTIGEEDVDEASRADTIRIHLIACYKQYEQAQRANDQE